MKQAKHFGVVGAVLGFFVALVLAALAYYLNSHGIIYHLDKLYLALAPTSLILMATEHATPSAQAMVVLISRYQTQFCTRSCFLLSG
jgi:hypothetical protein